MTTYKLYFDDRAEKEFRKLGATIQDQFNKKLLKRLDNPHVPADRLSGFENCYRIKLRSAGFRMIYQVEDEHITIVVVAVGKRDSNKDDSYDVAKRRL